MIERQTKAMSEGQRRARSSRDYDDEAPTRSDARLLPDEEERSRWTMQTLVALEGESAP
jgi:hypothetical protein